MHLRKPSLPVARSVGPCTPESLGDWGKKYPAICEFLSLLSWEDGSSRVPGSLILFWEDGSWKACLNDKDTNRVGFLSAATPTDLLGSIEKALCSDRIDWRAAQARPGANGRKGGSGRSRD
jgi:hypothetical protein